MRPYRINESEKRRILNLHETATKNVYLSEQSSEVDFGYGYEGKPAGQEVFDHVRGLEEFVPFVYDDKAGYPPKPYDPNSGSPKGKLTIGYGTTDPEIIQKYLNKISKEEADRLSAEDINSAAETVREWQSEDPENRKLTKGMYIALIDMAYNRGEGNFRQSGVLKQITNGNYKQAAQEILNGKGIWGHPDRLKKDYEMFCRDGGC